MTVVTTQRSATSRDARLPGVRGHVGASAEEWHSYAMPRTRVSTTVDGALLASAREVTRAASDAALLDQALHALVAQHRHAEVDRAYAAYDEHPLSEHDEWGDLASFRAAAAAS